MRAVVDLPTIAAEAQGDDGEEELNGAEREKYINHFDGMRRAKMATEK